MWPSLQFSMVMVWSFHQIFIYVEDFKIQKKCYQSDIKCSICNSQVAKSNFSDHSPVLLCSPYYGNGVTETVWRMKNHKILYLVKLCYVLLDQVSWNISLGSMEHIYLI